MKTRATILYMKTILEILIRLQNWRDCCRRAIFNPQLTGGEKAAPYFFKSLVRGCLPAEILFHYDRMKDTEPELLKCPEVFAMAVLVSTYRNLSPRKRQKLVNHFATPPRGAYGGNGHIATPSTRTGGRRLSTTRRHLMERN